ncbi:hypothetical protein GCM10027398_35720 [Azotobacter salinestris]
MQSLAVFPQSSALLQPGKRALDYPTLRYHGKGVQFNTPSNLYLSPQQALNRLSKRLARIATIRQDSLHAMQVSDTTLQGQQGNLGDPGHLRWALRWREAGPSAVSTNSLCERHDPFAAVIGA